MSFLFTSHLLCESVDHFFLFFSKFSCLLSKLFAAVFEFLNAALHLVLLLFGHECFTHSISDGALVKSLVSLNSHADFVSNTHQQESTFGTVDSDLTDELIKALGIKLFTDGANTSLSGLSLSESLIKFLL